MTLSSILRAATATENAELAKVMAIVLNGEIHARQTLGQRVEFSTADVQRLSRYFIELATQCTEQAASMRGLTAGDLGAHAVEEAVAA